VRLGGRCFLIPDRFAKQFHPVNGQHPLTLPLGRGHSTSEGGTG